MTKLEYTTMKFDRYILITNRILKFNLWLNNLLLDLHRKPLQFHL